MKGSPVQLWGIDLMGEVCPGNPKSETIPHAIEECKKIQDPCQYDLRKRRGKGAGAEFFSKSRSSDKYDPDHMSKWY